MYLSKSTLLLHVFHRFLLGIVWSVLNKCMNKREPLTDKQYQLLQQQQRDTQSTDVWLKQQGFNTQYFDTTHPKLLQAQAAAHQLLTCHSDRLNTAQQQQLRSFQQQINNKHHRARLKLQAAYPILNILNKIRRQLFQLHRQLHK